MPLIHGKSQKAFEHNLRTEMHEGKPQKQSLAIAYSMKRKAMKHKAHGGEMEHEPEHEPQDKMEHLSKRERAIRAAEGGFIGSYQSSKDAHITHPDLKNEEMDEYNPHEEPGREHDMRAMEEDERSLGQHGDIEEGPDGAYSDAEDHDRMVSHPVENQDHDEEALDMVGHIMKQRAKCFAKGGKVEWKDRPLETMDAYNSPGSEEHLKTFGRINSVQDHERNPKAPKESGYERGVHVQARWGKPGQSYAGHLSEIGHKAQAKRDHEEVLSAIKAQPEPDLPMAHGGDVDGTHMCSGGGCSHPSHSKMYSEGGRIANKDLPIVDDMPAEYDDLHLDDHLNDDGKADYTGANSGDELGDAQEDHDRADIVSRIMNSRKKKDRNPAGYGMKDGRY